MLAAAAAYVDFLVQTGDPTNTGDSDAGSSSSSSSMCSSGSRR
jgi:hypothetical protein